MKKTLIVFFSRTGCTRAVVQELAALLNADMEELRERQDRAGLAGFLGGGRDAAMKKAADLLPTACAPAAYDLVIVATPVWAFTMCPAVRTWLQRETSNIQRAAFIATQGGSGAVRTFRQMEEIIGQPPVACLTLIDKQIRAKGCAGQIAVFADACRAALA